MLSINCPFGRHQCKRGRVRNTRRGTALIEFALVIPILVALFLGLSWFGQLFAWKHVLNNSAREGARLAAVDCTRSDQYIRDFVKSRAGILPNASKSVSVDISATTTDGGAILPANQRSKGGAITVTVNYTAKGVFIPNVIVGDRELTSASTFRMECSAP